MTWRSVLLLGLLVATSLVTVAALRITRVDPLPSEIWVLRTPDPQSVCTTPGGAEVDLESVGWSDTGISLWFRASDAQKYLWQLGLGEPVGGVSYEPSGRVQARADGDWHHYLQVPD